jgi:hypothetical protein
MTFFGVAFLTHVLFLSLHLDYFLAAAEVGLRRQKSRTSQKKADPQESSSAPKDLPDKNEETPTKDEEESSPVAAAAIAIDAKQLSSHVSLKSKACQLSTSH